MATPFLWTSRKTVVRESFKKTAITPSIQAALDSVFNGTLNPKGNRSDWYRYLNSLPANLRINGEIGITSEDDLSLALPPIGNVNLPLLEKIREGLSKTNANAASYPYSAGSASDIQQLIKLYAVVKLKVLRQQTDVSAIVTEIQKRRRNKINIKQQLLNKTTNNSTRKSWLAKLSTELGAIRRLTMKLDNMKKEYSKGYRYQMSIRKKLEEVFFKAPKWKFKTKPDNLPPKSTRAGDVPRTDEIFSNEELFSKSSGISNRTIYDAIQSEMEDLTPTNPDIHPIPWKNLLILPTGIQGLPPRWNTSSTRIGQATNEMKLQSQGASAALIATWEQFATFGTKGFANPLQKALAGQTHRVDLSARVDILFNKDGQIVPSLPWWDNEILVNKGEKQIGEHLVLNQTKISNTGGDFISQVGFAWQYKIPLHSRATMQNTPWELAVDENGNPFKEFNVPKGTTLYAVRLAFIKADGSVVPLSNIISGSDVHNHMKLKLDFANGVYDKWNARTGTYGRTRKAKAMVSTADIKRLTKKARALLNITAEVERQKIERDLVTARNAFNVLNASVTRYESQISNDQQIISFLEGKIQTALNVLNTTGTAIPDIKLLTEADLLLKNPEPVATVQSWYDPTVTIRPAGFDPTNNIDIYTQSALYLKFIVQPEMKGFYNARDFIIDKYNNAADKVENLEKEQMSWFAGDSADSGKKGTVYNYSTEHAPGLIGKSRAINQVMSFLTTCWPQKYIDEQTANNTAPGTYTKPGFWLPFEQDLPAEACLAMEPWLQENLNNAKTNMLLSNQLRASNFDKNRPMADVSYASSMGYDAWLNEQKTLSTQFTREIVQRKIRTVEQISKQAALPVAASTTINTFQIEQERLLQRQIQQQQQRQRQIAAEQQRILEEQRQKALDEQILRRNQAEQVRAANQEAAIQLLIQQMITIQATIQQKQLANAQTNDQVVQIQKQIDQYTTALSTETDAGVIAGLTAQIQGLQTTMATLAANIQAVKTEIDTEEQKLATLDTKYKQDLTAAIVKRNTDLETDVKDAEAALKTLELENSRLLGQIDSQERLARKALEKQIQIMEQQALLKKGTLADIVLGGKIDIFRQNRSKPVEEHSAPADLRYGGGYFWSESDAYELVPYGTYLVYDEKANSGDRFRLAWSGLDPSELKTDDDKDEVLDLNDVATNQKLPTKSCNIQPVLTDNVLVNDASKVTDSLLELKRVTTNTNGKDLVYLGKNPPLSGPRGGFTLQFYDTLMKPGTYVEFILKKQIDDDASLSDIEMIRNRLVNHEDFKSAVDNATGNDLIDITSGQVLSGTIVCIRIANVVTLAMPKVITDAKNEYNAKQVALATAAAASPADPALVATASREMNQAKDDLEKLKKDQGKFDYQKYKTGSPPSMEPIVVADIQIAPGMTIKNVPYSDIAEISLCSRTNNTSKVVGDKISGTVSYYSKHNDDTFEVNINNVKIERIKKENLRVVYADTTPVCYFQNGELIPGTIKSFNDLDGTYVVTNSAAGDVTISFDNVSMLEANLDTVKNANKTSIYQNGMKLASYVPLFHKIDNDADLLNFITNYYDTENANNINKIQPGASINNPAASGILSGNNLPVLMRAEIKLKNNKFYNLAGNINNKSDMEALLTLMNSNKPLVDPSKVLEIDNTMVEIVAVSSGKVDDGTGNAVACALTLKYNDTPAYVHINFADIETIKLPQIFDAPNPANPGEIAKVSQNEGITNLKSTKIEIPILESPLKSSNLMVNLETIMEEVSLEDKTFQVSHLQTSTPKMSFEISSGGEVAEEETSAADEISNDKVVVKDEVVLSQKPKSVDISSGGEEMEQDTDEEPMDEIENYPTSWSKPRLDIIAKWANTSSPIEKKLLSEAERALYSSDSDNEPAWVRDMGGFASESSETKEIGGFASTTSDSKTSNIGGFVTENSDTGGFISDTSETKEIGGFASETSDSKSSNMGGFASETSDSKESNMGGFASETSDSKESNMGGFASETSDSKSSNMGGFVSETMSDTDQDDLTAIISKIDRQQESLWAEDSDTDTM